MEKGHYGHYSGNARHSRVTNHNMDATKRDDEAHMEYLKEDVKYDNKHGHSDSSMTADEKHISKLAGDLKYDEKHHGSARHDGTDNNHNGDIRQSPSGVTQFFRKVKNDKSGPYNMVKNLAATALAIAPIPSIGKLNAVKNIAKAIRRVGWVGGATPEFYRGLYTRFRATIAEATVFTIKFKCWTSRGGFSWEDWEIDFHWYLRNTPGNYFICEKEDTTWERKSSTEEGGLQTKTVPGSDFDSINDTVEVTISIPFEDIYDSVTEGDEDFVFCIGTELKTRDGGGDPEPGAATYYGDIEITSTAVLTDNHYKGTINTNFLDKLENTMHFSDVDDLTIKNGIFRSAGLDTRTALWEDDRISSSNAIPLAEVLLHDKFLLYNQSRQKITSEVRDTNFYKPLRLFEDTEQAGLYFILVGYSYNPEQDHMNLILAEYDNTETIDLI